MQPVGIAYRETDGALVIEVAVPGFDHRHLTLAIDEDRMLVVTAIGSGGHPASFCAEGFKASFGPVAAGFDMEGMKASCHNGLLRIHFPPKAVQTNWGGFNRALRKRNSSSTE